MEVIYEGGAGPELLRVDTRLSQEEVKEVLQNGKGNYAKQT